MKETIKIVLYWIGAFIMIYLPYIIKRGEVMASGGEFINLYPMEFALICIYSFKNIWKEIV